VPDNRVTIVLDAQGSEAVAKVFNDLAAKGKDFAKNLSGGANEASTATQGLIGQILNLKSAFAQGQGGASLFSIALTAMTNPIVALGVAVGAAAYAVSRFTDALMEDAKAIRSLSQVSGLGIEAAMGLRNAFELMGKDSTSLNTALFKLSAEIDNGGEKLRLFGINVRDNMTGALKEPGEVFLELRTKMSQMTNTAQQNATGIAFMGRQYKEIASIFRLTDEQMANLIKRGNELNPITEETVRLTVELKKAQNELKLAQQGFTDEIAERTLPQQIAWTKAQTESTIVLQKYGLEILDFLGKPGAEWYDWLARMTNGWLGMSKAQQQAQGLMLPPPPEFGPPSPPFGPPSPGSVGKEAIVSLDALKSIEDLRKQLAILNQPEEMQGVARLRQQFADFAQKEGPAAAAAAKGIFDQLIRLEIIKATKVDFDALAKSMRALDEVGLEATMTESEKAVQGLSKAIFETIASTKNLGPAAATAFKAYASSAAEAAFQAQALKKVQQEDVAVFTELNTAMEAAAQTFKLTGDLGAMLQAQIAAMTTALIKGRTAWGDLDDRALDFENRLKSLTTQLQAYLAEQKKLNDALVLMDAQIAVQSENSKASVDSWNALARAVKENQTMAGVAGVAYDSLSVKIRNQQKEVELLAGDWGATSPQVKQAVAELQAMEAEQFDESIAKIAVQAQVLGSSFDATGAMIGVLQGRLKQLAEESNGVVTPAMQALGNEIQRLGEQQKIEQMVKSYTDGFEQMLTAVRGFLDAAKGGLSDFFQLVGRGLTGQLNSWKDFADGVRNIWKSMLNSIIKALADWLASTIVKQFLQVIGAAGSGVNVNVGGGGGGGGGVGGFGGGNVAGGNAVGGGGGGFNIQQIVGMTQNLGSATSAVNTFGEAVGILGTNLFDMASGALGFASEAATLGPAFGGVVTLGPAATGITSVDMIAAGANIGQVSQALQAVQPAVSGFGVALAGVGAALAVFSGVMALVNGQMATGIGTLSGVAVGAVAGAIVGSIFPGIGTLLGALVGAGIGGALGGVIGGLFEDTMTEYEIKRKNAEAIASIGVASVVSKFEAAAKSQSPAQVQAALASREGQVYTNLRLPEAIAQSLSIVGAKIGDKVQVEWSALSLDQFTKLIAMFKANPTLATAAVQGSADVPYLPGDTASTYQQRIKDASIALIEAFNAIGQYIKNVNELASSLNLAAKIGLPADFSAAIKTGLVDPLKQGMLALLDATLTTEELTKALDDFEAQARQIAEIIKFTAEAIAQNRVVKETAKIALPPDLATGLITSLIDPFKQQMKDALLSGGDPADVAKRLQEIQKEQAALGSLVTAYSTIDEELMGMGSNMEAVTARVIAANTAKMRVLEENVTTAMDNLADAADGISMEEEVALIDAAHAAVMARYKAEMDAIAAIEQQIATTLKTYGDPLNALTTAIGVFQIKEQGSAAEMGGLISAMTTLALTSKSSSEALWATNQALAAIVTTGVAVATQVGKSWNFADWQSQATSQIDMTKVVQAMFDQAAPLMAKMQADANAALAEGNLTGALDKLNQMAQAATSVAQGAIAAVNAWATAAKEAVNTVADAQIKAITDAAKVRTDALELEADGLAKQQRDNDKLIKSLNKQMDGIQKAADKQIAANDLIIEGLNDQIDGIQKVADAQVKANEKLIDGLNDQIDAISKIADAQVKANETTIKGLNASIKLIEQQYAAQIKANEVEIRRMQKEVDLAEKQVAAETKVNDRAIKGLNDQIDGINKVADAAMKANDVRLKALDKEISGLQKIADAQIKVNDAAAKVIDDQIDAIQTAAQLQRDANDAQIDALQMQQSALQDAIQSAKDWQRAVESVAKQINDLLLGPQAPLNPMQQLEIARDAYQKALAGATTPEGIAAAQTAASDYLKAAGGVYARPSLEYQGIFKNVTGALQGMESFAQGQAGPTAGLESQLASVTAQLQSLEASNKALEAATKAQLDPLQAQAKTLQKASEEIRDTLETALAPLQEESDALQELNQTIKDDAEARIEPLRAQVEALQNLNDTLKDSLDAFVDPLKENIDSLQELNAGLKEFSDALTEPLKSQVTALQELNQGIKDDAEARIAPLKEQVDALQDLNKGIKDVADAAIEPLKASVDTLTQANKDIKRSTDALLQPMKDEVERLQTNNEALAEHEAAIRENITAINKERDDQVFAINESRRLQIEAIDASAKLQTQQITSDLNATLIGIRDQEKPIYEAIRDKENEVRDAVTGGLPTQLAIKIATENAADALGIIKGDLHAFLEHLVTPAATPNTGGGGGGGGGGGSTPTPATPGPASQEQVNALMTALDARIAAGYDLSTAAVLSKQLIVPMSQAQINVLGAHYTAMGKLTSPEFMLSVLQTALPSYMPTAQHGIWRTQEGPYYLHADERVLTKSQADMSRSGAPTIQVNVTVNVSGKADEEMIERAVKRAVAETETSARIGRLNRIIQEQVR
jgi:chromosome segregation ATPase